METSTDFGFITEAARWLCTKLSGIPSAYVFKNRSHLPVPRDPKEREAFTRKRALKVDGYVCSWVAIELCLTGILMAAYHHLFLSVVVTVILLVRIQEICFAALQIAVFGAGQSQAVSSVIRTLVLSLVNYNELWLCFAAIYSSWPRMLNRITDRWDPLYFSGTTQLTIGFGEIHPCGWGRAVALAQGWIGVLFGLLILSRLVGFVPSLREVNVDDSSDKRILQ